MVVCGQQKGSKWWQRAQPRLVVTACAVQNPHLQSEQPGAVIQSTLLQGEVLADVLLVMRNGCYTTQAGMDAGRCTSVHVGSVSEGEIPG